MHGAGDDVGRPEAAVRAGFHAHGQSVEARMRGAVVVFRIRKEVRNPRRIYHFLFLFFDQMWAKSDPWACEYFLIFFPNSYVWFDPSITPRCHHSYSLHLCFSQISFTLSSNDSRLMLKCKV